MTDTIHSQDEVNTSESGFTLIEMIVSIIVATFVISLLMQQLVMTVGIKRQFELDNRISNESYYITEQIKYNIFTLQPHSIEIIEDSATQTVIQIVHEYDIISGAYNTIVRDYSNPVLETLTWDKTNQQLTYNGTLFHSSNVKIVESATIDDVVVDTAITIIPINPVLCADDPGNEVCGQGILKLELVIQIELDDGSMTEAQLYVTTIII